MTEWVCKCGEPANYKGNGKFYCSKHWDVYLEKGIHEYLPTKEYCEEYNKCEHGLKIHQFCVICHEHAPCKHNMELN